MSRKNGRIYYEKDNDTVVATRTNKNGVRHYGRGSDRSAAAADLRHAEKGLSVQSQFATANRLQQS